MVQAHKRQLKLTDSRRKTSNRFVFHGESVASIPLEQPSTSDRSIVPSHPHQADMADTTKRSNKRRREDDEGDCVGVISSDSESDFYGFAADSFIFGTHQDPEFLTHIGNDSIRRSGRRLKKKRKEDYVYY